MGSSARRWQWVALLVALVFLIQPLASVLAQERTEASVTEAAATTTETKSVNPQEEKSPAAEDTAAVAALADDELVTADFTSFLKSTAKKTVKSLVKKGLVKINEATNDDKLSHFLVHVLGGTTSFEKSDTELALEALAAQLTQVQSSIDHMNDEMERLFNEQNQTQLREAYYEDLAGIDQVYNDIHLKWEAYTKRMQTAMDCVAVDDAGCFRQNPDGTYVMKGDTPEEQASNQTAYDGAINSATAYLNDTVDMKKIAGQMATIQGYAIQTSANPSVFGRFNSYAQACYPFTYQVVGPANDLYQYIAIIQYEAYQLYAEAANAYVLTHPNEADAAKNYNSYVGDQYDVAVNTINAAADEVDLINRLEAEGFDTSALTEDGDTDIDTLIYERTYDENNNLIATKDLLLESLRREMPIGDYYVGEGDAHSIPCYEVTTTSTNLTLMIASEAVKVGDYMKDVDGVTKLSTPMVSANNRYQVLPGYDTLNGLFSNATASKSGGLDVYGWLAEVGGLTDLATIQANLMLTQQDSKKEDDYYVYTGMECNNYDSAGAQYGLKKISLEDDGKKTVKLTGGEVKAQDIKLALIYVDITHRLEDNTDTITAFDGDFDDSGDYYLREGQTLDISNMKGDVGDLGVTSGHVGHVTIHVYGDHVTIVGDPNRVYKNLSLDLEGCDLSIVGGFQTTTEKHSSTVSYGENTIRLEAGAILSHDDTNEDYSGHHQKDTIPAPKMYPGIQLATGTTLTVSSDDHSGRLVVDGSIPAAGIRVPEGAALNLQGLASVTVTGHTALKKGSDTSHTVGYNTDTYRFAFAPAIGVENTDYVYYVRGPWHGSDSHRTNWEDSDIGEVAVGTINIADCPSVEVPVDQKGSITKYANYEGDAIGYGFTQGTIQPEYGVSRFFAGYNGTQDQPNGSITNSHIKTDENMGSNFVIDNATTFETSSGEALTPYVLKLTSTGEGNAETDETIYADIVAKDGTKETVTFGSIGSKTTGYKFFKSSIANIDLDHLVLYMNNNEDKSKIKSVSLIRGGTSNPNGAYTIPVYTEISQSNPWTGSLDSTVAAVDLKTSTQDNSGTDSGIAMGVVNTSGQSLGTTPIRFDTDRNHLESGDTDTAYFSASGLTADAIAGFTLKSDTGGDNSGWSLESMSNLKLLAAVTDGLSETVTDIAPGSLRTDQWIIQRDYAYTFMLNADQTRQYQVDFKTSTKSNAGTDSDIQICLYNAAGESSGWIQQWHYNNPSGRDLNEKGDVNSLNFATDKDLGEITHIEIQTDDSGSHSDWYPEYVHVTPLWNGTAAGETAVFNINKWIEESGFTYTFYSEKYLAGNSQDTIAQLTNACNINLFEHLREDIIDRLMAATTTDLHIRLKNHDSISKELLQKLKDNGKNLLVEYYDDAEEYRYGWLFRGDAMTDITGDINMAITEVTPDATALGQIGGDRQVVQLHFAQSGDLGLRAGIRYRLPSGIGAEGQGYTIYHQSDNGRLTEVAKGVLSDIGCVAFNIEGCSDYLVALDAVQSGASAVTKPAAAAPGTGIAPTSTAMIAAVIIGLAVLILGAAVLVKRRR